MGVMLKFPQQQGTQTATGFYPRPDAARLARVPVNRLDAWRREGIVRPTLLFIDQRDREIVGYSFAELNYLRVIRMLRDDRQVSLEMSVKAMQHIDERCGPPGPRWADYRVILVAPEVYVVGLDKLDDWKTTVATKHGQKVWDELIFGNEFEELRIRSDALLVPMQFAKSVQMNPAVASGMPTVRGTRIETRVIRRMRESLQPSEIRREFPILTPEQIKAALQWEKFLDVGM
jgi:uncharacterized protein (DUF433 family)